jgi:cob(I)alamin adenosyltransferase
MATKAYTGTGDKGETSLFGGIRVKKTSLRIEAYGDVDELNSYIGVCRSLASKETSDILETVQNELFVVGADLATPLEQKTAKPIPRLSPSCVPDMEKTIDRINAKLPDLKRFILPAGTPAAAHLHVARSIARRAERRVQSLAETEKINQAITPYLNRLSSLLFVLARYENWKKHIKEKEWVA